MYRDISRDIFGIMASIQEMLFQIITKQKLWISLYKFELNAVSADGWAH